MIYLELYLLLHILSVAFVLVMIAIHPYLSKVYKANRTKYLLLFVIAPYLILSSIIKKESLT
jgi:hypothetical protein